MKEPVGIDEAKKVLMDIKQEMIPIDLKDVKYDGLGRFATNGTKFFLSDITTHELCSMMGVSRPSYQKASENLKRSMIQELIPKDMEEMNLILSRQKEDVYVANHFLNAKYPWVSTLKVFEEVADILKPFDPKVNVDFDRGYETVDFITKEEKKVSKVGDILRAGVTFESKFSGLRQILEIGSFAFTLRCLNGAIGRQTNMTTIEVAKPEDYMVAIRGVIDNVYRLSKSELLENMAALENKKSTDVTQLIHRITKEHPVGGKYRTLLMDRVPSLGPDPSYYSVVDMITTMARDQALRSRRKLQTLAGYAVLNAECRCELCKSKL